MTHRPFLLPASLVLALLLLPRAEAEAGRFSGHQTTILRVYDLIQDPERPEGVEKVTSYRPLDAFLRLSWDELGARRAWTVDVSLRGRVDLGGGRETQEDFRVLHAEASWRAPSGLLHLSFGRLRDVVGLGWRSYDGLRLDFREHRHWKGFVQAGLPVDLADSGAPEDDGFTWAAGLDWVSPRRGSIGLDYHVRRLGGTLLEETAGLDFVLETKRFRLAGNADYSIPNDRFGETAVLAQWRPRGSHRLEARVTRVEPVLPLDSIWAVFTINPYTETRLSWERRDRRGVDWGAFVSHESYEETGFPGGTDIDRAALTVRFEGPRRARHRGELGWQEGWSGDRLAARWDVDVDLNPRWRVGGGVSVNRYENAFRLTDSDEDVALRARLSYDHFGRFDVALGLDQYLGRDRDSLRAQLIVRTKLGAARRQRPWWGGHWRPGWSGGAPTRSESAEIEAAGGGKEDAR